MMRDSDDDFPTALRDLLAAAGISQRALVRATGRFRDPPYSIGYLSHLLRGDNDPTPENMEILARAAGVPPTYFRAYREHLAAEEAVRIMNRVGLDKTLAKLRELDRA
jgi:transcriptional regulator with XRE-family HTH domain